MVSEWSPAEILDHLDKYKWIHNEKLTHFSKNILTEFPDDWEGVLQDLNTDDIRDIPYGLIKEHWPFPFKHFLSQCLRFSSHKYDSKCFSENLTLLKDLTKTMCPKKIHEVSRMAKLIDTQCKKLKCNHIVDIGSGMGYLDFVLTKQLGYNVLGIELSGEMSAKSNAKAQSISTFKTINLKLDGHNMNHLEDAIYSAWNFKKEDRQNIPCICLVGLHCCGDLSVSVLKTFCQIDSIKSMLLFSCCYHSMQQNDDGTFKNFPLSTELANVNGQHCLNLYSFRLAAQQTRSSWRLQTENDHHLHMLNVAYRSILELALNHCNNIYKHAGNLRFKKSHRKLTKVSHDTSFRDYLEDVCLRSDLKIDSDSMNKILLLYKENEIVLKLVEPFTMLQVLFQPIIEHLILMDRCKFIQEQGFISEILQVFDDQLSSRNCAIIASKCSI